MSSTQPAPPPSTAAPPQRLSEQAAALIAQLRALHPRGLGRFISIAKNPRADGGAAAKPPQLKRLIATHCRIFFRARDNEEYDFFLIRGNERKVAGGPNCDPLAVLSENNQQPTLYDLNTLCSIAERESGARNPSFKDMLPYNLVQILGSVALHLSPDVPPGILLNGRTENSIAAGTTETTVRQYHAALVRACERARDHGLAFIDSSPASKVMPHLKAQRSIRDNVAALRALLGHAVAKIVALINGTEAPPLPAAAAKVLVVAPKKAARADESDSDDEDEEEEEVVERSDGARAAAAVTVAMPLPAGAGEVGAFSGALVPAPAAEPPVEPAAEQAAPAEDVLFAPSDSAPLPAPPAPPLPLPTVSAIDPRVGVAPPQQQQLIAPLPRVAPRAPRAPEATTTTLRTIADGVRTTEAAVGHVRAIVDASLRQTNTAVQLMQRVIDPHLDLANGVVETAKREREREAAVLRASHEAQMQHAERVLNYTVEQHAAEMARIAAARRDAEAASAHLAASYRTLADEESRKRKRAEDDLVEARQTIAELEARCAQLRGDLAAERQRTSAPTLDSIVRLSALVVQTTSQLAAERADASALRDKMRRICEATGAPFPDVGAAQPLQVDEALRHAVEFAEGVQRHAAFAHYAQTSASAEREMAMQRRIDDMQRYIDQFVLVSSAQFQQPQQQPQQQQPHLTQQQRIDIDGMAARAVSAVESHGASEHLESAEIVSPPFGRQQTAMPDVSHPLAHAAPPAAFPFQLVQPAAFAAAAARAQ